MYYKFEDTIVPQYQRGIKNPQIEDGQTTQWTKEKRQKDKQPSTNDYTENKGASNTNHTNDGRKSSSCSNCGIRRITLVTNLLISHD